MDWYIDESGNDQSDDKFVVVAVRVRDPKPARVGLHRLRKAWPFLAEGLKAATADNPGWVAMRWLRSAPWVSGGPRVTVADLAAAEPNREDYLRLLERAVHQRLDADPDFLAEYVSWWDLAFARWACRLRQRVAVSAALPGGEDLLALRRWANALGLGGYDDFPAWFSREYKSALLPWVSEGAGTQEERRGALRGALDRYPRHLSALCAALRGMGPGGLVVQGRGVPQVAAAGTTFEGALRPLEAADVERWGAAAGPVRVVSFYRVADNRVEHRIADAAAHSWLRSQRPGGAAWTVIPVVAGGEA